MITLLKDFLQFIRKPNANKINFDKNPILRKVGLVFLLIPVSIFIGMALRIGILFVLQAIGITFPKNIGTGLAITSKTLNPFILFFQVILLGPLIEKISFRLPLKFHKLLIPFSVFIFYVMMKLLNKRGFYIGEDTTNYIVLQVAIAIILFIIVFGLLRIKKVSHFNRRKTTQKIFL